MAWEPFGVSVQSIAEGRSDGYITHFAQAVRALNLPVAISFGHEMNGYWYPWGTSQTTPANSWRPGATSTTCSPRPGRPT